MGGLLRAWSVPEGVYSPLKHCGGDYASLSRLEDPLRANVELLKVAVLIARIAAGEWESWDEIELPSASVVRRLGIGSFSTIIGDTRSDSQEIIRYRPQTLVRPKTDERKQTELPTRCLRYCNLSSEPFDFLGEIVASMEIGATPCKPDAVESNEAVLINCIGCPPHRFVARLDPRRNDDATLILTDADHAEPFSRFVHVLSLPASYGALRAACRRIVERSNGGLHVVAAGRR
jgi:hypothetical protein